jgi:iron complex outermembrane receptor protein
MRPCYLLVGAIIGLLWGQEEARKRSFIPRTLPQAVTRQEALITIQGLIQDAETKEPLPGASIRLLKSGQGTLSRLDGSFALSMPADGLPPDEIVVISYVGYQAKEIPLAEFEKSGALIALTPGGITMKEIQIIASTANVLITPVNFTRLESRTIMEVRGSQDVTEAFRLSPSTYASREGGGWGDSRINLRGFEQENIAVLINGIPVNDMENSRVYWSNWVGILDVADEIQVQKGVGNARIVLPTIGGTLNLRTLSPQSERQFRFTSEVSNVYTLRTGFVLHTGQSPKGWAVTMAGGRAAGPGYIRGTDFESWQYYLAISKDLGRHRLMLQALGAPQWHYQRFTYLRKRDIDTLYRDIQHNYDYGYLDGQIYSNFRNYYHKPLISLSHYWQISEKVRLLTSAYTSFGRGGGSGILNVRRDWDPTQRTYSLPTRWDGLINWERVRVDNQNKRDTLIRAGGDTLIGYAANLIHRNSVNSHNWYGLLSNVNLTTGPFEINAGIDARYYVGYHYRVVKDLFGADFWIDTFDVRRGETMTILVNNQPRTIRNARLTRVGDRVNYDYDSYITYIGGFSEIKYDRGPLTAVLVLAGTQNRFQRQENFRYRPEDRPLRSPVISIFSYVAKAGVGLRITDQALLFANGGYFTRPPFFQFLFVNDRFGNEMAQNYDVEKVFQSEAGIRWQERLWSLQLTGYWIEWRDKVLMSPAISLPDGTFTQVRLNGLAARHQGVELEGGIQPLSSLRLGVIASIGDWKWQNDVFAVVRDNNQQIVDTVEVYAKGLRVGSAPQTQITGTLRFSPVPNLYIMPMVAYYDRFWATFDPATRTNPNDRSQPWRLPAYTLIDLAAGYEVPIATDIRLLVFGNIHNLLDTRYIVTAQDGPTHDERTGRFFYGFGRTWNFGLRLTM